jgi:IS605 OrfB family transposase
MINGIIRTDKWKVNPIAVDTESVHLTVSLYRQYIKRLGGIIFIQSPAMSEMNGQERQQHVERLVHRTKQNPEAKYARFFDDHPVFSKLPSGYRRAAITAALGQMSSFASRYLTWQSGIRRFRTERFPLYNSDAALNPALYHKGSNATIQYKENLCSIKVWNGTDWVWTQWMPITLKGKRHELLSASQLSPYLLSGKAGIQLGVPFELKPQKIKSDLVCSVDLGINTSAVAVIVDSHGTVYARKFFKRGLDIDHVGKLMTAIRHKAILTKNLFKGFAANLYRKAYNTLKNMAHHVSRGIVDFAAEHGCSVIVLEDMKGWRPKAGKKRSGLKQRFHTWFHRRFHQFTESKWKELGGKIESVYPRGTSSWAYDGSGKVKRDKFQYELCTFKNGKQFNADLNGAYNIAARYWAKTKKLSGRNRHQSIPSKSSRVESRMPTVLSDLWNNTIAPSIGHYDTSTKLKSL